MGANTKLVMKMYKELTKGAVPLSKKELLEMRVFYLSRKW